MHADGGAIAIAPAFHVLDQVEHGACDQRADLDRWKVWSEQLLGRRPARVSLRLSPPLTVAID
jgi:hypothetical protein